MKLKRKLITLVTAMSLCVGILSGAAVNKVEAATMSTTTITPELVNDFTIVPQGHVSQVILPAGTGYGTTAEDEYAVITPVKMDFAGVLYLNFSATGLSESVETQLYSDAACTFEVGYYSYLSSSTLTARSTHVITSPGTYYLRTKYSYSIAKVATPITVSAYAYSGSERTLTGDYQAIYSGDATTKYHKLTVKSDSLVTLYGNSYSTYSGIADDVIVNICNSNKVTLEKTYLSDTNAYTAYYPLKKGTYYVGVADSGPYQLKYTAKSVKDQSGASKKKAKTLKKKKTLKGIVTYQDKTSKVDWFKFKLKKNGKITLNLKATCNQYGRLKMEIVSANPNYRLYNNSAYFETGEKTIRSKKIRKGTYYIKISKYYASYNGSYSIKYVK